MANFAKYAFLPVPDAFSIGGSAASSDIEITGFDLSNLDPRVPAVLFFRIQVESGGSAYLTILLNQRNILDYQQFSNALPITWHEAIPRGVLTRENNYFTIGVSPGPDGGSGRTRISDLVLLYSVFVPDAPDVPTFDPLNPPVAPT